MAVPDWGSDVYATLAAVRGPQPLAFEVLSS